MRYILILSITLNGFLLYKNLDTPYEKYSRLYNDFSNECADIEYRKKPNTNIWNNEQIVSMFWCTAEKLEQAGEI